jgi:carboxypeptidase D
MRNQNPFIVGNLFPRHIRDRARVSSPTAHQVPDKILIQQQVADNAVGFAVNGSNIPNVTWDVGESYAGLLPISSNPKEDSKLWFWFFPTTNPAAGDEILIWLNGGPGKMIY